MRFAKTAFFCSSVLAISLAFATVHKSYAQQTPEQKKISSPDRGKNIVIGRLQFRDTVVVISKGKQGTAYTVQGKDGKTLDANLSEKRFQAKYPSLYDRIKDGQANNDATLRK